MTDTPHHDKTPISAETNAASTTASEADFAKGLAYLKSQLKTLPAKAGVYRMLDENGDALYVGKARDLSKRVPSYTRPTNLNGRLMRMVAETKHLEIIVTATEVEALLLESNLIKQLRPRYNILLRDDKSFAHIMLSGDHDFGRLVKHRGPQSKKGDYFGPFASAGAVNRTITSMTRAFMLRTCSDNDFATRSRPCLQYQIKRCTGPCAGLVSKQDYQEQLNAARRFLSGKSDEVQKSYAAEMSKASDALEFETAALWRNRIRALTAIQASQDIHIDGIKDADVIAIAKDGGQVCIQVFFIRNATNYGNKAYFPAHVNEASKEETLAAFLGQFYEDKVPAPFVLVSDLPEGANLLAEALSAQAGRSVSLTRPARGGRRKMMDMAVRNADEALARKLSEKASQSRLLSALADTFDLDETPKRVEIYDNSHIQGTNAVGAMVCAGPEGFMKSAYRKFNMRDTGKYAVTDGDDFGMMRQMIYRRFERALKEDPERTTDNWPDLLLIDGGRGQLNAVREVLQELHLDDIAVVGVSKGPDRNAGREQFHIDGRDSFTLAPDSPAMHFLQRLRDESHRFAIGAHRTRRTNASLKSPLDEIEGIGPKRKKALLAHFGSARSVSRAAIADLMVVEGISEATASDIYHHFHSNGGKS